MKRLIQVIFLIVIILAVVFSALWLFKSFYFKTTEQNKVLTDPSASLFLPENLTWVEATSSASWEPRDSGEVFLFQDKMWLIGGLNGNDNINDDNVVEYWNAKHFNDIWNTEDGVNWELVATSTLWSPRRSMSVVFFNNKLWMLGGWSSVTGYTSDVWASEDGTHWEKIMDNAPFQPLEGQTLTVFRGKLWKIGGVNYDERQVKNDVWYSENGIEWRKVEDIPWRPRWDHAVASFNGKLFLTGGMNLDGEIFNDIWVSEDGTNWVLLTDNAPWGPRQGHSLQVYKNKLWIIGGLKDKESGLSNDVWFSDDGIVWKKTINDPPWTGREDFFSAVFNDKILVFGGMDVNWRWRNDVWFSTSTTR